MSYPNGNLGQQPRQQGQQQQPSVPASQGSGQFHISPPYHPLQYYYDGPPPPNTNRDSHLQAMHYNHDRTNIGPIPERARPHLSLNHDQMPRTPTITFDFAHAPHHAQPQQMQQQQQQPPLHSPFFSPDGYPVASSNSAESNGMTEYFPPFDPSVAVEGIHRPSVPANSIQPGEWSSIVAPLQHPTAPSSKSSMPSQSRAGPSSGKVPRHQFTACGACRHRRVKCDLRARQEEAERDAPSLEEIDSTRATGDFSRHRKVSCTNCQERGTNCVDEYAPLKAAKQLRRGKRISEIEMLYGKSATNAALASQGEGSDRSASPAGSRKREVLPELTKEFFESAFFRRFQVQRPLLDPIEFINRYFSKSIPCAAAMGPEGSILCHSLYAWAVSYGVDEHGQLDVPDGGGEPVGPINLLAVGENEVRREADRQRRRERMSPIVRIILREIDDCGLMRKPSWDGVRALLLILPLTEGISSPVERLAMYQAALSQVYMLCSLEGQGYDGLPAGLSSSNGGVDEREGQSNVRVRIYWYAFVHEGITTGLKGGNLHLDEEDLSTIQETLSNQAIVYNGGTNFQMSARMATAPIRLALACRLIHKALTGPRARRRDLVNVKDLHNAWEALERSWEEFESIKYDATTAQYQHSDDTIRFADGWKIFLFEAQNVIRKSLEERLERLKIKQPSAFLTDATLSAESSPEGEHQGDLAKIGHLVDIARSKCEVQTRLIMEIIRTHVGSRFFEWDASLVRDGTYYAAMLLAKESGSDEDIAVCLQALNELRWAYGKSLERSQDLRNEWYERRSKDIHESLIQATDATFVMSGSATTAPGTDATASSLSDSPYTSPTFDTHSAPTGAPVQLSIHHDGAAWSVPGVPHVSPPEMVSPVDIQYTTFTQSSHPHDIYPHQQQHTQHTRQHPHIHQPSQQQHPTGLAPHGVMSAVAPSHIFSPDQAQGGQYVLQPDGCQIFVPYGTM